MVGQEVMGLQTPTRTSKFRISSSTFPLLGCLWMHFPGSSLSTITFQGPNCVPVLAVFSLMSWGFPAKWRVRSFYLPASVSFMSRWRISRLIDKPGRFFVSKATTAISMFIIGNTKWIRSENAKREKICLLWQRNDSICKPTSDLLQNSSYAYPRNNS